MPSKEMSKQQDQMSALGEEITSAARKVARDWPGVVDADDIEQDLWVRLLETESAIAAVLDLEPQARSRFLHRSGHVIAAQYRNEYDIFSGNFYYSTEDVRGILQKDPAQDEDQAPMWELLNDWELTPKHPPAAPDETPGSETLTEQMDLAEGMELLEEKNAWLASLIRGQFFEGVPRHTHRRYLTRAVDALTQCMNNIHRKRESKYREAH